MNNRKRTLTYAGILIFLLFIMELAGSYFSRSLSLLSDSFHLFLDISALLVTITALRLAENPPTDQATYGHHRYEILATLVNSITLFILGLFILFEAYKRYLNPQQIIGNLMFIVGLIGLFSNIYLLRVIHHENDKNLSVKSVYWHILGDTLSSVGVVTGALIIIFTGFYIVDILLSILIVVLIFSGAGKLLYESLIIILERVPRHINIRDIETEVLKINEVKKLHDIHVWSLCSDVHMLSAHVIVNREQLAHSKNIINKINQVLSKKFNINHATLQIESEYCGHDDNR